MPVKTRRNKKDKEVYREREDTSTESDGGIKTDTEEDSETDVPDRASVDSSSASKNLSRTSIYSFRSTTSEASIAETSTESFAEHSSNNPTPRRTKESFHLFDDVVIPEKKFSKPSPVKQCAPKEDQLPVPQNQSIVIWALGVVIIAMFVYIIFLKGGKYQPKPVIAVNQFDAFSEKINNIKTIFPSQENRFWRTVKASGKHVLNISNPEYPAILLFVTNKPENGDKFDASSCLARKISSEFDSANLISTHDSPVVDCGTLTTSSAQKQKLEFDNKLRSYLDNHYKSVIVEHLELLSPSAALLLHGYCDNDNAPYKDVMIILVLHVDGNHLNARSAELLLKQSWEKELASDKVDALMSRVANNIVVVNPESNSVSSHCN